jgi:hypothetical protein
MVQIDEEWELSSLMECFPFTPFPVTSIFLAHSLIDDGNNLAFR